MSTLHDRGKDQGALLVNVEAKGINHVKDIFYVIGESFDKMHFTYNWVDLE